MSASAAFANALWLAAGHRSARRFDRALHDPAGAQRALLVSMMRRHAGSVFGRAHGFRDIADVQAFQRCVPLATYDDVAPYVDRIARGEPDVLSCGRVTHLAPTSGSTGGRKLIPFTASLQAAFNAAVNPWMRDLVRQRPGLLRGPAYWSISPLTDESHGPGAVPVGFADDADYLGGARARIVRRALAVPSSVRHVRDVESFARLTLLALLRRRDLRMISIWHPSFLDAVLAAARPAWREIVDAVATGECPWQDAMPDEDRRNWTVASDPRRAAELEHIGAEDWPRWWPRLEVLSCWGEQAAEVGWRALRDRLPHVLVQPKGLLATEGVVTIPSGGAHVLAVTSHLFEFIDRSGDCHLAHELERGREYEVVITNDGGLWRYRLGDVVECTGYQRRAPTLRFLGRAGRVSDLRGEKLQETFVAEVLRGLFPDTAAPAWSALRATERERGAGYELLVTGAVDPDLARRADIALSANPNYALARRLGQLERVRVLQVDGALQAEMMRAFGGRLGDAKPSVLLARSPSPE